jgi:hypothetical protein
VKPGSLEIVACDPDHAKGVAFNMLFMVWRYHTTAAAYRQGIVTATKLVRHHPEGIGIGSLADAARWHAAQQARLRRPETATLIERMATEVRRRQHESYPPQSNPVVGRA